MDALLWGLMFCWVSLGLWCMFLTVVAAGLCSKQLWDLQDVMGEHCSSYSTTGGGWWPRQLLGTVTVLSCLFGAVLRMSKQWPPPSRLGGCCPAPREAGEMPKRAPGRVVVSCLRVLHGPKSGSRCSLVFRGIFASFPPCR